MTTIVYDHKARQIAVDGRSTGDEIIQSDEFVKYLFTCDQAWFFCGATGDFQKLLDAFSGKQIGKCHANAIIVIDKQVFKCGVDEDGFWKEKVKHNCSIGSGHKFGLAALDHGKSAKEAVEYASKRDIYTGGKITVYDIESGEIL